MNGTGFLSKYAGSYRTRVVADGADGGGDVGGAGDVSHSSAIFGSVPYTPSTVGTAQRKPWDSLSSILFLMLLSPILIISAI